MLLSALILHFFFPHESNNHRARLLHPVFVGLSLLSFLLSQIMMPFLPRVAPVVLGYASDIPPEKIVELTNQKRVEAGAPPLDLDPQLTQAALAKAADMFAHDYWAHVSPQGREPWAFVVESGYRYRYAGENLARDFSNPREVVEAWMASPSHKENLLSSRYQDIGVAVVDGELNDVETTLVVQLFGTKFSGAPALAERPSATESAFAVSLPVTPQSPEVAASTTALKELLISPFSSTKRIALFLVSLFLTLLSIDLAIVNHRKVARRSSHSFAHFLFFGMILITLLAIKSGAIL